MLTFNVDKKLYVHDQVLMLCDFGEHALFMMKTCRLFLNANPLCFSKLVNAMLCSCGALLLCRGSVMDRLQTRLLEKKMSNGC